MVLQPVLSAATPAGAACQPAWRVVERAQKTVAAEYWLVSQPDHAALAGALAAHFTAPGFPAIDPLIVRAIEVHDAGWAIFACEQRVDVAPAADARGKPISFLEIDPPEFLRAWTASIDCARSVCPAGGYIVARHFSVLAEGRLASAIDTPANSGRLRSFLDDQAARCRHWQAESGRSRHDLELLLLVLQFCDLASLYLCCGAADAVEFPQQFEAGKVRVRREKQAYLFEPSPFRRDASGPETSLAVAARRFPATTPAAAPLAFLLW